MANFVLESNALQNLTEINTSLLFIEPDTYVMRQMTEGHVFKEKNYAKDWETIYVSPSSLDICPVEKGMREYTEPVLVITTNKPAMAFVFASNDEPVFFRKETAKSNVYGYTIVFRLSTFIIPEYYYFMCKYGLWDRFIGSISYECDELEGIIHCYWDDVENDDPQWHASPISILRGNKINIPSIEYQKQRIEEAKAMESMIQEKMDAQTRKYEQKEWLNEAHIRNSKHRLSNEMMPIRMKVERLRDFFSKANGGVKLTDIIGKATGQTVDDLLTGLYDSVKNVEAEINNLTKSETAGEPEQVISVAEFLNDYCDKIATKYTRPFKIEKIGLDDTSRIKISPKLFIELLDNIVGNAVQHGFIENRDDYVLQVKLETVGDKCKISIANNGVPMSERAQKEYFVRGSFAGTTGHTGIGGARVFEICDKAGGEAMQPYSEDAFPVVISVLFPLV